MVRREFWSDQKDIKEGVSLFLGIEDVVLNSYSDYQNRRILEVERWKKLGQRKEM